jgi:hypothetical protein
VEPLAPHEAGILNANSLQEVQSITKQSEALLQLIQGVEKPMTRCPARPKSS